MEIRGADLPLLGDAAPAAGAAVDGLADGETLKARLAKVVRATERAAIVQALKQEAGSASRAAKRLGLSRASLYNKLKELGIKAS